LLSAFGNVPGTASPVEREMSLGGPCNESFGTDRDDAKHPAICADDRRKVKKCGEPRVVRGMELSRVGRDSFDLGPVLR
jgi:hypothetical protein